jgi:hypothetical protein
MIDAPVVDIVPIEPVEDRLQAHFIRSDGCWL